MRTAVRIFLLLGAIVTGLRLFERVAGSTPSAEVEKTFSRRGRIRSFWYRAVAVSLVAISLGIPILREFPVGPAGLDSVLWRLWPLILMATAVAILRASDTGPSPAWTWLVRSWPISYPVIAVAALAAVGLVPTSFWNTLLQLWPVAVLLVGLLLILRRRVTALHAAVPFLVFSSFLTGAWVFGAVSATSVTTQLAEFHFPQGKVAKANLTIDLGIDNITVGLGLADDDLLTAAFVERSAVRDSPFLPASERFNPGLQVRGDTAFVDLRRNTGAVAGRSFFGSREAVWQFDLNPGVSFELSLKGGVGNSVLDLT